MSVLYQIMRLTMMGELVSPFHSMKPGSNQRQRQKTTSIPFLSLSTNMSVQECICSCSLIQCSSSSAHGRHDAPLPSRSCGQYFISRIGVHPVTSVGFKHTHTQSEESNSHLESINRSIMSDTFEKKTQSQYERKMAQ